MWNGAFRYPSLKLILFFSTRSKRVLKIWSVSNPIINSKKDERTNTPLHSLESDTTSHNSVIFWWTMMLRKQQIEEYNIHVSVINWRSAEELRCLFVRKEWSEYFLGLWRHPCARMHNWDSGKRCWDEACLMIIEVGGEPLSRVMWRGYANVSVYELPLLDVRVVSLGMSSQLLHMKGSSSQNECAWFIPVEHECIYLCLNGNQFRQV